MSDERRNDTSGADADHDSGDASTHPDRAEANRERQARDRRDREELGRPDVEAREQALARDVTERRDREARENAELAENRNTEEQQ